MKLINSLNVSISKGGDVLDNQMICIVGPTASGKTALSVALAKARNTEIISADSMQVYCGMDIGTAKPTTAEQQNIHHHMFDICQPGEDFSVARYVALADECAQQILQRGKTPIVVGGTGLYMDALVQCSRFSGDESDVELRQELMRLAEEKGNAAVHEKLSFVDPVSAERLHPNNLKRVIRAIEVYTQTGCTLDELNEKNRRAVPKYNAVKIGICPSDREILYERINRRVDDMLENGLLNEIKLLLDRGQLKGTAAQAIGYKEFIPYFEHETSLESCIDLLKQHSRNYAKRQLTWLKRDTQITWVQYDRNAQFNDIFLQSTKILSAAGL